MVSLKAWVAALGFSLLPGAASAMSYSVVSLGPGRSAIAAEGQIDVDEGRRFASFLVGVANTGGAVPRTLLIHSPGGVVEGSMQLGLVLRQLGYGVMVARARRDADGRPVLTAGGCASACVYALMGGTRRHVPGQSRVFVHRPRTVVVDNGRELLPPTFKATDSDQRFSFVRSYTRAMGVDPGLVDLTYGVPHEKNRLLSPAEVSTFRLSGGGAVSRSSASSQRGAKTRAERKRRPA